ncbi:hypothetical protein QO190_12265 [Cloacibacterium sp. Arc13]|uniref:hypothetical protein n=1 Tax=unclassified Cloacibacterium TaxID=2620870 RepID=UPI00352DD7BC
MINSLFQFITKKQIILYNKHRSTLPIVLNKKNHSKFYFWDIDLLWKFIPFKTSDKRKHIVMYIFLNIINPKYILSKNWISIRESLYKIWTSNHESSKFIVVQHGSYVGGVVTDIPHKFTKCDVFLTWGEYFVEQFNSYNSRKKVSIVKFGNPIFNNYNRDNYHYSNKRTNKILILPTALDKLNLEFFYSLINKLRELQFDITIKTHGKQGNSEKNSDGSPRFPKINNTDCLTGPLYPLLQNNDYDFIISDHSTSLLDAVFFKNKVIYFDPNNKVKGYTTNYSKYLVNLFEANLESLTKDDFYNLVSVEKQEQLLENMIFSGNNELSSIN